MWGFLKRKKDAYTTAEAAEELGISRAGVERAIQRRTIPAEKFGRDYKITREALEAEMRKRGMDPDASNSQ